MRRLYIWSLSLIFCMFVSVAGKGQRQDSLSYKVEYLDFNTKNAEFGPGFYKEGILFCSDRESNLSVQYLSEETGKHLPNLYFTRLSEKGKYTSPKLFSKPINSNLGEGPVSYVASSNTLYFTRNDLSGAKSKLGIFSSVETKGKWSSPQPFTFNKEKTNVCHPAISPSGNFMVFASDMPGGFGGTDLYISYFRDNKWSKPQNLGSSINTEENEITPFIHENGTLYFSSDGHKGNGGFDIFKVVYNNFEWKGLRNIGYPFNSAFDDHGFITDKELLKGYFVSNRLNGEDDDDIYYFEKTEALFEPCDTMQKLNLCRTFFETGTMNTDSLPLIYEWDLGDGTKMKGLEVKHCYAKPGKYEIQLNVVDMVTNQVYMNEATFELDIDPIKTAYVHSKDTMLLNEEYTLDGLMSHIPEHKIKSYAWDLGDGQAVFGEKQKQRYSSVGVHTIRLSVKAQDSLNNEVRSCVIKKIRVMTREELARSRIAAPAAPLPLSSFARTVYNIRDKQGNTYKIQLATSDKPFEKNTKKFEGMPVDEYYDRNLYGYTTGNFKTPSEAYPALKRIRRQGYKEAVVIAMNNGKIVSGTDSSFFVDLPEGFVPVKMVQLKGKVTDRMGKLIPAEIRWESLTSREEIGKLHFDTTQSAFSIGLLDGDLYGYYASYNGYFPASDHLDLREENDLSEIRNDIVLVKIEDLTNESAFYKMNNLFFEPDKFDVQPESYPELKRLALFLHQHPHMKMEIAGHTDHLGDEYYNQALSQKRANAVMNYLVKQGCKRENLFPKGYGKSKPITANKKLRELNRRVEFRILKN